MNGAELLLVMVAAIVVTALAHKRGLQAPLVLVMIGTAVSFIPALPRLEVPPELILSVVLPPLLYSTAVEFSFVNFMRNLWPIIGLGVVLVVLTALGAGFTAYLLVPEITLAAGLVLGSVVGPSDAVTAVAIGRRLGLPKRVMTILTGESLINDAAALTLFTITTVAVTGQAEFISSPVLFFGYGVLVGIVVGLVLARLVRWVQRRLENPGLETVLGLILPFTCYLAAEELSGSGVIAVVTAGFAIGHSSGRSGYAARIQERDVWRSLDVLLEAFVFAYMGLQARFILEEVRAGHSVPKVLLAAVLVLLAVMAIRVGYVLLEHGRLVLMRKWFRSYKRRNPRRFEEMQQQRLDRYREREEARARRTGGTPRPAEPLQADGRRGLRKEPAVLPFRHDLVIGWTGMRGVVTLAAAAGIPILAHGEPFPGRAVIQTIAFVVAVGTILVQGATLPAFIRSLKINNTDDKVYEEQQRKHAMEVTRRAATEVIAEAIKHTDEGDAKRLAALTDQLQRFQQQREELQRNADQADGADLDQQDTVDNRKAVAAEFGKLRMKMLQAQREALTAERDAWALDDDVYREMLEQLDLDEAATGVRMTSRL
jgi:NhaP-type Na+/H+ or K+/H+ antiporter